ncbi:MAG TPA: UbiD family decarboxylase [Pirellulaceae bacterium]|nr:UbiD family decarboxylase [Pirellulaceae bacterium]
MFSLRRLCDELDKAGHLVRLEEEVDARLEAAEIQRRVYASGGPAVFYANVKGCRFPMVSNLFGTIERARYLFRNTYESVRRAIELKIDPSRGLKEPLRYLSAPLTAWRMRPKVVRRGPVIEHETTVSQLPQLVCWPDDGGPFVTLPQCYTQDIHEPGLPKSNLGMYRIQLAGNQYITDREIGLHYQTHRGIGVHHTAAIRAGQPLRVNVFVGGHPAMMLSAVMPLPEGMSELTFAGALAGERIAMIRRDAGLPIYADADFCITGYVDPHAAKKPEGPFGDHLGYYSLAHDFPVLNVEHVYHRRDAVWPFTVVGRPPQEDTTFGQLIHELTGDVIPTVLHGVKEVHAVDAAGVHPLLLAIGSERYMPFVDNPRPQEILTQACAILGQGQLSLAKYLWIASRNDDERLSTHDIGGFFRHVLERIDWRRDLHFHTNTTIDTLDYSGQGLNMGSKVVLAACGPAIRELPTEIPGELRLPEGFSNPRVVLPGILLVEGERGRVGEGERGRTFANSSPPLPLSPSPTHSGEVDHFCRSFTPRDPICRFPLIVLVDDSDFAARNLNNFLWVAFTRSNPASDIGGIGPFTRDKHWGCEGSLLIDARIKPHHAPPLVEDPQISKQVDALAARGGPLAKWL